jgi:hypothetical protein
MQLGLYTKRPQFKIKGQFPAALFGLSYALIDAVDGVKSDSFKPRALNVTIGQLFRAALYRSVL